MSFITRGSQSRTQKGSRKVIFPPLQGYEALISQHFPSTPLCSTGQMEKCMDSSWTRTFQTVTGKSPLSLSAALLPPPPHPWSWSNSCGFASGVHFLFLLPLLATLSCPHTQYLSETTVTQRRKCEDVAVGETTQVGPCMPIPAADPADGEPPERASREVAG